jgi:MSHA biogenesis protein MshJ
MKSSRLQSHVNGLAERYRGLSLRERMLVLATLLAATWFLWDFGVNRHLASAGLEVDRQSRATLSRLDAAVREQRVLNAARSEDPNVRLQAERARLQAELSSLDESMVALLDRFVDPDRMPAMLEDLIRHHAGLSLKHMTSLPVETIDVSRPAAGAGDGVEQQKIFRHPVRLVFEGSYFDAVAYLEEMEKGPWRFGWRQLRYQVESHPLAEVIIEIETLSREESWIGV